MQELPKHYDHQAAQARCRGIWDAGRFWHAEPPAPGARGRTKIFSIVIPPPNVTGALHLGHALNTLHGPSAISAVAPGASRLRPWSSPTTDTSVLKRPVAIASRGSSDSTARPESRRRRDDSTLCPRG